MWQISNEAKWYPKPQRVRDFLVATARQIKAIDPYHLVSGGAALQCWQGARGEKDFLSFNDDAALDVVDVHDYGDDRQAWPTCMERARRVASSLGKPLIIGEAGVAVYLHYTAVDRAKLLAQKMQAAALHDVQAYLVWSMNVGPGPRRGFDFYPGDDTYKVAEQAAHKWFLPGVMAAAP